MHFDSLLWNVSVLEAIGQIFTPALREIKAVTQTQTVFF